MRRTKQNIPEDLCETPRCSNPAEVRVRGVGLCGEHHAEQLEREKAAFLDSPEWKAYVQRRDGMFSKVANAELRRLEEIAAQPIPTLWPAPKESQQIPTVWPAQITLLVGNSDNSYNNRRNKASACNSP